MPMMVDVRILPEGEPSPWLDIQATAGAPVALERVAIMQGGMTTGRTSVALFGRKDDGSFVMIETSAAVLQTLIGAVTGACKRFGDDR